MTPAETQAAMRDALAAALQEVQPDLGVTVSYQVADRALERVGFAAITEFIALADPAVVALRDAALDHGPLPPDAAAADAAYGGVRDTLRDQPLVGDLITLE